MDGNRDVDGLAVAAVVVFTRSAKKAEIEAGVRKYTSAAETMDPKGQEAALDIIVRNGGKVKFFCTDGDTAAYKSVQEFMQKKGLKEGKDWAHFGDVNHWLKSFRKGVLLMTKDAEVWAEHAKAEENGGCPDKKDAAGNATGKTKACRGLAGDMWKHVERHDACRCGACFCGGRGGPDARLYSHGFCGATAF